MERPFEWRRAEAGAMNDDDPPADAGSGPDFEQDSGPARRRLAQLRQEHEDLDASVRALEAVGHPDQIRIARLKKRKLGLRDEMARLNDELTPDIMA